MKKLGLFLILGFALITSATANNSNEKSPVKEQKESTATEATYSIQGTVYDPVCNEAISGATIIIDGKKYYSDLSGNFEIPALSKGKHTISVDFVSYQKQTLEIDLDKSQNLEIKLKQQ